MVVEGGYKPSSDFLVPWSKVSPTIDVCKEGISRENIQHSYLRPNKLYPKTSRFMTFSNITSFVCGLPSLMSRTLGIPAPHEL